MTMETVLAMMMALTAAAIVYTDRVDRNKDVKKARQEAIAEQGQKWEECYMAKCEELHEVKQAMQSEIRTLKAALHDKEAQIAGNNIIMTAIGVKGLPAMQAITKEYLETKEGKADLMTIKKEEVKYDQQRMGEDDDAIRERCAD